MKNNKNIYRYLYNGAHSRAMALHQRRCYLALARRMAKNIPIKNELFSRSILADYRNKWKKLDAHPNPLFFKLYSSLRNEVDINYVPDYLYRYPIELLLNNRRFSVYLDHKCLYEKRFPELRELFPSAVLRLINGEYYDREYNHVKNVDKLLRLCGEPQLVAKEAIDTGAGLGVRLFTKSRSSDEYYDDSGSSIVDWLFERNDVIVQKLERQSSFMSQINPTSVNTLRVVTYRSVSSNDVFVTQTLIKRGAPRSFVDNLNSGGNFIEIKHDARLSDYGVTKDGLKVPNSILAIDPILLSRVKDVAVSIAKTDMFHRQIFFDIFIDVDERVRVMELNYSAHPTIQAICGPAFGSFTDEVIEYCRKKIGYMVRVIPFHI